MSRKVETDDLLVFEGIVSKNSRTRVGQQSVALQTVHGLNNNDVTEAGLEGWDHGNSILFFFWNGAKMLR